MQFSEKWLRQWINPPGDVTQLTEALTMLGLEVDGCEPVAGQFSGVVVAQVIAREPHPDADRLSLCRVDVGEAEPVAVVCGAPNVRPGLKVAFVKVGGVLPGDFNVKKAKLRGIESHGMICSSRELGMGDDHAGIIELPEDAPIGMNLRDYLLLEDHQIDIELTPNRGDCASICGVARELAAHFRIPLNAPDIALISPTHKETFPITVSAKAQCPRYLGRVIRNIKKDAVLPLWMQEQLRRSGFHLIHPVVDITNYVMLELGQPLHAFDLDKLASRIEVRLSTANEPVTLLDGKEVQLNENTLVIADAKGVQAVAGVMGGADSAVSENTQHIFLESAYFDAATITRATRQLGLVTDSAYRFERGVDFELQAKAVERFTQLLQDICGAEPGPITEVVTAKELPPRTEIILRRAQISRILGIELASTDVMRILSDLGMQVRENTAGWSVVSPSYRFDITLEIDLIEELVRLHGYNQLPSTAMLAELTMPQRSASVLPYLRLPQLLTDLGYFEAITYSFVDPNLQRHFDPQGDFLTLANPLSVDMSVMRTSLWPGLIQALHYNLNRQAQRVRFFETGLCFIKEGDTLVQCEKIAGLMAGQAHDLQWARAERGIDFFDIKGQVQQLLAVGCGEQAVSWRRGEHPALHPGQSAALFLGETCIGYVGILHPNLVLELGLSVAPALFEINISNLSTIRAVKYKNISKFPTVRRDLAIVIEELVSAEVIERKIRQYGGHLLLEVKIFDIYQGEGIEKGKKSVALSLTFQDPERTLIDEDINNMVERVVTGLQHEFKAILRA